MSRVDHLTASNIRNILEDTYDIPFFVDLTETPDGLQLDVKLSRNNDLFLLTLHIRNWIRLTITVKPEKFSAFMLKDMSEASDEQKKAFAEFASQIKTRKGKYNFSINNVLFDPEDWSSWPKNWNQFSYRITRSPITADNEDVDLQYIIEIWLILVLGMFLSILNIIPEQDEQTGRLEGKKFSIELTRSERNPINRQLCLAANGYTCLICGMNFQEKYGLIGKDFIHVHHLKPVSLMDKPSYIDPIRDLIPVCPNCHAMLHRKSPPFTPEELKQIMTSQSDQKRATNNEK